MLSTSAAFPSRRDIIESSADGWKASRRAKIPRHRYILRYITNLRLGRRGLPHVRAWQCAVLRQRGYVWVSQWISYPSATDINLAGTKLREGACG
jgi:hypothetical protein